MNYWPRWINAIKKRTATLSLAQMGAYDRLLDHYYAEEKPLPADLVELYRICGAQTKLERDAVQTVLAKFFELRPDGYRNERADEEIIIGLKKIEAAQENGKKGGRPKGSGKKPTGIPSRNPVANPVETQSESSPSPSLSTIEEYPPPSAPPPAPASAPTRVHEAPPAPPEARGQSPTVYGEMARRLREGGISRVNPGHQGFRTLVDAGVTAEEFMGYADKARSAEDPFSYLVTTVVNERKRAKFQAAQLHQGVMPRMPQTAQVRETFRERDDRLARERMAEWAPTIAADPRPAPPPAHHTDTIDMELPHGHLIEHR